MSSPKLFSNFPKEVLDILTVGQKAQLLDNLTTSQKAIAFEILVDLAQLKEDNTKTITFDDPIPKKRGKDKKPRVIRNSNGKNIPVYKMVSFEDYRRPRVYDKKTHLWPLKHQSSKGFYCPFEVLVTIILNYSNGLHAKDIFNKVKSNLRLDTWNGLNTIIYYYRAGALNDSIYEHARSFGYNPQDLISRECEHIGGK